jgi:hypothetical protein
LIDLRSEDWRNISNEVTTTALPILPHIRSRKLRSEIISSLFESKSAEYFNAISIPVQVCESDRDPDLTFTNTNTPCEIKVTGSDHIFAKRFKWMGGKYSKRTSDHIFIAYCYTQPTILEPIPTIKYFIAQTFVSENDWKTIDNGNENYYATVFTTDDMIEKEHKILVGDYDMRVFNLI